MANVPCASQYCDDSLTLRESPARSRRQSRAFERGLVLKCTVKLLDELMSVATRTVGTGATHQNVGICRQATLPNATVAACSLGAITNASEHERPLASLRDDDLTRTRVHAVVMISDPEVHVNITCR